MENNQEIMFVNSRVLIFEKLSLEYSAPRCINAGGRSGVWRTKWCSKIWRHGWRGGARVGFLAGSEFAADFSGYLETSVPCVLPK